MLLKLYDDQLATVTIHTYFRLRQFEEASFGLHLLLLPTCLTPCSSFKGNETPLELGEEGQETGVMMVGLLAKKFHFQMRVTRGVEGGSSSSGGAEDTPPPATFISRWKHN